MKRSCAKCHLEIASGELPVICEGFCEGIQRFHAKCVGLTADECGVCYHRNILWMCDHCCELMLNEKFRNTVNGLRTAECKTESDMECLRTEVQNLSSKLNHFMESAHGASMTTSSPSSSPTGTSTDHHSLLSSTKTDLNPASTSKGSGSSLRNGVNSPGTFKLHLSNIANDVTENEVAEMVEEALGITDTPLVKCLVPSWQDTSTMDFISFKVEIDISHRAVSLNPSRWPASVRCREFKEYRRDVWHPRNRSC